MLTDLGYKYEEITKKGGLYDQIYKEATKKYTLIHPDAVSNYQGKYK